MPNSADQKHSLARNGVFSAASWFLPLLLAFVVTPVVVRGLGNELYGLYALIIGFISYTFTFGVGRIAAKYVAEFRAANEPENIAQSVSATLWLSLAVAISGGVIIIAAARPIVVDVLNIPEQHENTAIIALYVAAGTILVTMLSQVFQYALQGVHRFDLYLLFLNLSGVLINAGNIAIVISGYGVVALIVWNLIVTFLVGLLYLYLARRYVPAIEFRLKIKREVWRSVSAYGGSIILYQVFGNMILVFERSWIVRHFGSEELTYYVVPMTLGLYLHGFVGSLVLVIFPAINELLDDNERLSQLYRRAAKLVLSILVLAVVTAVVGGRMFLYKWIGPEFAEHSYPMLVTHVLTFALLANSTIVWQITEGYRRAGLNAAMTFAWFVIAIPLMVVLSRNLGAEGVALGRLFGVLVTVPMVVYVERRFLRISQFNFWSENIIKLLVAAAGAAAAEWVVLTNLSAGWVTLVLGGIAGLIAYAGLLLVLAYFDREERQRITGLVFRRQVV